MNFALEPCPAAVLDEDDATPFDKLREHCGVMAVYNHPDAARLTYWGLYALQHRGQESGGIASADGEEVHDYKGMGLVSEIFTDPVLAKLPGHLAIATRPRATPRC
jgi:amidophosphoribosyltransferase